MMLAEQVAVFYPDLKDARFESAFAIYHQRYSTNTFPRWWLAQPFRMLAHNGEINTLKGNLNWMKSHEIRMSSDYFGDLAEDIKPIVQPGDVGFGARSTTSSRCWCAPGGRRRWRRRCWCPRPGPSSRPRCRRPGGTMYAYSNAVMEPWDGPAALAMTDGRWVCGGLDRNGLRPMRYVVTGDGLRDRGLRGRHGPDRRDDRREKKGALGPGQMLGVDMSDGQALPRRRDQGPAGGARSPSASGSARSPTSTRRSAKVDRGGRSSRARELRRRQIAAGYTIEELEVILHAMAEDGKEAIGSMGDDTPPAVLSDKYRPLSHYFRQNFSQVTNPPIDSLREHRVMSLKTRFGNLKNVLDQDNSQTRDPAAREPVRLERAVRGDGDAASARRSVEIDCTFPAGAGDGALRDGARAHPRRGRGGRARRARTTSC